MIHELARTFIQYPSIDVIEKFFVIPSVLNLIDKSFIGLTLPIIVHHKMNKTMNNNVVLRTQIYNLLYCTGCVTVKHLIKGPFLFVIKSIESKEKKIMCDLYLEKKYLILVFFLLF